MQNSDHIVVLFVFLTNISVFKAPLYHMATSLFVCVCGGGGGGTVLYSKPETHLVILANLVNKIRIKYCQIVTIIAIKNSIA